VRRSIIGAMAVAILTVSASLVISCTGGSKSSSFGKSTETTITSIEDIQKNPEKYVNQAVTIEGKITRECPMTGCWWYVQDKTGQIRVDSKRGDFNLPLKQEGRIIRTTGIAVKTEGGELQIAASGAELR
jgi:hypothetical protein